MAGHSRSSAPVLVILAVTVLSMITGCAAGQALTNTQACTELQDAMTEVGLAWPIAGQPVSAEQARALGDRFASVQEDTTGDTETVLAAWLQGYEAAAPYLVAGDQDGFLDNTDPELQDQLHLASTLLATRCGWTD